MLPAPQTFEDVAGQDLEIPVIVKDGSGVVVDVSGFTTHFRMARRDGTDTLVGTEISPANAGCTVTDGPSGEVTVTIANAVSSLLIGTYYWVVWITDLSGDMVATARGYWTFGANPSLP